MPLHGLLAERASRYRDRLAVRLIFRYDGLTPVEAKLTYRQLDEQASRFAAALAALGVRRGDRVALLLPNLPQFVIGYFGALRAGALVVCANPAHTARELMEQFGDAGVETVVGLGADLAKLREVQARVPALLQYTGGTTGAPKAAILTHYNLIANALQMRGWMSALKDGSERVMGALPFFHRKVHCVYVYGMTVAMNLAICMGAELLMVPDARAIDFVMTVIEREKVSIFPGVPTTYIALINRPDVAGYDLRSVRACISGAASLPLDIQLRFDALTGGRLVEGYGLTEASPVTHCTPIFGRRVAGSMGLPLPDTEAKIVDPDTRQDLPNGQRGELWVRGPQVMKGYWNSPAETEQAITGDGWLRTGDIAHMDEDGYFTIVDRLKDIIITSGFNVAPREVEEVLYEHPAVREAAVAGLPDPYRGERVKAYVVLKVADAVTPAEIIAFCKERLAPYKVPVEVEFRSQLPKSAVGKVLRRILVEEERSRQAGA